MERHNEFEEQIRLLIKKHGNVHLEHPRQSVRATEVLKDSNNKNKLFTDASSPYRTEFGNQKRTEFVYHSPDNNIDWRIECKSRKTINLIGEITHELNFVADIPENVYCLVLSDILIRPYILNQLIQIVVEKGLELKVWIGSKKDFKKLLKNKMN